MDNLIGQKTADRVPLISLTFSQASLLLRKHGAGNQCAKITFIPSFNKKNTTYILRNEVDLEFVIRFSKSWLSKTENEVATILYLKRNSNLNVPKIVGFCRNEKESIMECEYILMEKLEGVPLASVFTQMSISKKKKMLRNIVLILAEFQNLKFNKIGSFVFKNQDYKNMEDIEIELGPLLETEYKSGPYSSYLEYLKQALEIEIERASLFPFLIEGEGSQLMEGVKELIDQIFIKESIAFQTEEVFNVEFSFCHVDLHAFNILVDEETCDVTGVVDFEFSGVYPMDMEWRKCCSFLGDWDKIFNKNKLQDTGIGCIDNGELLDEETQLLRSYFINMCNENKVKTLDSIPGQNTRGKFHYLLKSICPWWIRELEMDNGPTTQKLLTYRATARCKIKQILNHYGV